MLLPAFAGRALREGVLQCDALELMRALPDASVDAIITDLPYGTTACSWDEIIPFEPMWAGVKRVLKPRGAFVTTSSQPFTSKLVMSNLAWFRYDMIWNKTQSTGHLNSWIAPLRQHEEIIVFGESGLNYYPQLSRKAKDDIRPFCGRANSNVYGSFNDSSPRTIDVDMSFPRSVFTIANTNYGERGYHPTQKPVALYEYLIKTYTLPDQLVLDFCCGSGTTLVAAQRLGRRFIGCDLSAEYVEMARKRLAQPFTPSLFTDEPLAERAHDVQPMLLEAV